MPDGSGTGSNWADLAPRVISGSLLAVVGLVAVWSGGAPFTALVLLVVGLIGWEIIRLCAPGRSALWVPYAVFVAVGLFGALSAPAFWPFMVIFGVVLVAAGAVGAEGDRLGAMLYIGWVMLAGWGLVGLRAGGMAPVFWLVLVVVATDIAGYFAGRLIGGPKFWPKVSPKKTWSGTVAGWVAAGLVGLAFAATLGPGIVWLSVLVSFAGQMGDAAESALKRAKGVKDASALIPGHGGAFDRFDALMGAALLVTLARFAGLGG